MNYLDSDTSNSTNTVAHCDEKGGNVCLRLRERSHSNYMTQRVYLRRKSLLD